MCFHSELIIPAARDKPGDPQGEGGIDRDPKALARAFAKLQFHPVVNAAAKQKKGVLQERLLARPWQDPGTVQVESVARHGPKRLCGAYPPCGS